MSIGICVPSRSPAVMPLASVPSSRLGFYLHQHRIIRALQPTDIASNPPKLLTRKWRFLTFHRNRWKTGYKGNWGIIAPHISPDIAGELRELSSDINMLCELAGVEGFEPSVHGTKNRCLTAWLHPNSAALLTKQGGALQV